MNPKYSDDHRLVDLYLLGDKEAGDKLYEKAIPYIEKYVYHQTAKSALSKDDKDDIIMDSLKLTVERLSRYTGESSFCVFACGFANNIIKQAYRRHNRNIGIISLEDEFVEEHDIGIPEEFRIDLIDGLNENPIDIVIRKEQSEALKRAYESLNTDYQQIIRFRLINKVSVKEVAEITGKTEDSIDAMYRRALVKYRENFIKNYCDGFKLI